MHICVSKLTIIGSNHGLSPDRRQAIIWTNAGILLIGPWGTNFIEIFIEILTFSFKKMRLKVSSAKRWPFCLGLNVLSGWLHFLRCLLSHTGGLHDGFNSSPLGQNGHHFTDDNFRCIFVDENFCILIRISLKFVPKGPIDNNPALI